MNKDFVLTMRIKITPNRSMYPLVAIFLLIVGLAVQADNRWPVLPEPVSNNAVALVRIKDNPVLLSFMGLAQDKDWRAVHNRVFSYQLGQNAWQPRQPVPSSLPLTGRLAAIAVGIGEDAYLFGGYTVAEDHEEISSPDNYRYSLLTNTYDVLAPSPVPVDDAVALVYQERFIYLISGWHNDGNVNLVQIYDIENNAWQQASPFPGKAVFGHAGGIVGNVMLICDGVSVRYHPEKRRDFTMESACFRGEIDSKNQSRINWTTVPHPTATGRYRMAASGLDDRGVIAFVGGATNPYNFNGIGYNGAPAEPSADVWLYQIESGKWQVVTSGHASMDHRGLLVVEDELLRVGGMQAKQSVSDKIFIDNISEILP
ncbi:kelch repeat-containing protein [Alteromonas sp. ASW11-36]|uniref:Kelch repeat-containing protein n=1 Tax=Alteromonas arenosi TaxID=3055817 RepID=A0ABT7SZJ8_9ALTE|nr:kelch repeat-containing protein [Alteromonas sp. ASW11-36]MDM7861610.1 kelch repeat-containing protein [Alteromonas sp. ASW11-36]